MRAAGLHVHFACVLTSQVVFPAQADTLDRANLLGATVLLDFSFFETQNQV